MVQEVKKIFQLALPAWSLLSTNDEDTGKQARKKPTSDWKADTIWIYKNIFSPLKISPGKYTNHLPLKQAVPFSILKLTEDHYETLARQLNVFTDTFGGSTLLIEWRRTTGQS